MRIVFLLPRTGVLPIGGFKVVYEYANRLAGGGTEVILVHPTWLAPDMPAARYPRLILRYLRRRLNGRYRPDSWFRLNPAVRVALTPSLHPRHIPDADVLVATSWETAEWAASYPAAKGQRFYLIQHLETWSGDSARVMATWRAPLQKIVIARWLEEIARGLGESAFYIPNGLDFAAFGQDVPPSDRDPCRLLMLHHRQDWKGSNDGLAAVAQVREHIPGLALTLFGVHPRPQDLPEWVEYRQNPPQAELRRLYNQAAVFVGPSWTEGWGLPPTEAMMSGACLVATDIGGHREFAVPGVTALLSPPRNPVALAGNIECAVRDRGMRLRLAEAGRQYVQQFTWERAASALVAAFATRDGLTPSDAGLPAAPLAKKLSASAPNRASLESPL